MMSSRFTERDVVSLAKSIGGFDVESVEIAYDWNVVLHLRKGVADSRALEICELMTEQMPAGWLVMSVAA